jgi:hypothetical protein
LPPSVASAASNGFGAIELEPIDPSLDLAKTVVDSMPHSMQR